METYMETFPAIVELFGHDTVAGYVTRIETESFPFIQIKVPSVGENKQFYRWYSPQAIFCINPIDEEEMIEAAKGLALQPKSVSNWRTSYPYEVSSYDYDGRYSNDNDDEYDPDDHWDYPIPGADQYDDQDEDKGGDDGEIPF